MRCAECNYYWKDEGEEYPSCHCEADAVAPCEEEDYDTPDVDEEEMEEL